MFDKVPRQTSCQGDQNYGRNREFLFYRGRIIQKKAILEQKNRVHREMDLAY